MYEDVDENRELLDTDNRVDDFYRYCSHTKWVINIECSSCKHYLTSLCCIPFVIIVDAVVLVPQILINNTKMCLQW